MESLNGTESVMSQEGKQQSKKLVTIKNILFEFLFSLIKDDHFSINLYIVLILIQFIQILFFAFSPSISSLWNVPEAADIGKALGYISLITIYEVIDYESYLIFFYAYFFVVFVIGLMVVYSIVSLKNQNVISQNIYRALRLFFNFILTVLYIPIIYNFAKMTSCQTITSTKLSGQIVNEVRVMHLYSEVECWKNTHIIHGCCSIIGLLLLIFLGFISGLFFFDGTGQQNSGNSKKSSLGNTMLILYETVICLCFSMLIGEAYQPILVAMFLLGGAVIFSYLYIQRPFFNPKISLVYSLSILLIAWTGIMLVMALFVENKIFNGSLVVWAFCIPLILLAQIWKTNQGIQIQINNFTSPEQLIDNVKYIQELQALDLRKETRGLLFNGYIEFHNKICLIEDCPMKRINYAKRNISQADKKEKDRNNREYNSKSDKRYIATNEMITQSYQSGILKYPFSIPLRINYIIFLMNVIQNKQMALIEVIETEQLKCTVIEQFILYFLRRSLENQISDLIKNENSKYSELRYQQNRIQQLRQLMEQLIIYILEFWSQFSEEKPDLQKIFDITEKLFPAKMELDKYWTSLLQRKKNFSPKILRLYSKFLVEVYNDKYLSVHYQKMAEKLEKNRSEQFELYHLIKANANIDNYEQAILCMVMEEDKSGRITQMNNAVQYLFGYRKNELIGKNPNIIMPRVYADSHDDIIHKFAESQMSAPNWKDKLVFGKNSLGYAFPLIINTRAIYNMLKDETIYFAQMQQYRQMKNYGFVLCNDQGVIENISAGVMYTLGIDAENLKQLGQVKLQKFFPDIFKNNAYRTKSGWKVEYRYPKITENQVELHKGDILVDLNLSLQQISFKVNASAGWLLKTELLPSKASHLHQQNLQYPTYQMQSTSAKSAYQGLDSLSKMYSGVDFLKISFQMKMVVDDKQITYHGEFYDQAYDPQVSVNNTYQYEVPDSYLNISNVLMNTSQNVVFLKNNESVLSNQDLPRKSKQEVLVTQTNKPALETSHRINYGEGIKILRLFNQKLQDIDDGGENNDAEEEEDEEQQSQSQESKRMEQLRNQALEGESQQDEFSRKFQDTGFNDTIELQDELTKYRESLPVKVLKFFSYFVILLMIGLSLGNFIEINKLAKQIQLNIDIINVFSDEMRESQDIMSLVRELNLLQQNIRIPYYKDQLTKVADAASDYNQLVKLLLGAIQEMEKKFYIVQDQKKVTSKSVELSYDLHTKQSFDYNYATSSFIAKAHNVLNLQLNEFNFNQPDIFFIQYNGQNNFFINKMSYYLQMNNDMVADLDQIQKKTLTYIVIAVCIMIFLSIFFIVFLYKTRLTKQLILSIFLEITEKAINRFQRKCENFLTQLVQGEDEEILSLQDLNAQHNNEDEDEEQRLTLLGKRKKKFKNIQHGILTFIFQIILIIMLMESYFILNKVISDSQSTVISKLFNEYNNTCIRIVYNSFAFNQVMNLYLNKNWPIMLRDSKEAQDDIFNTMYFMDSKVQTEHAKNAAYNTPSYKMVYNSLMFGDVCEIVSLQLKKVEWEECKQFQKGLVQKGFSVMMVRYFQQLRELQELFYQHDLQTNETLKQLLFKEVLQSDSTSQLRESQLIYQKEVNPFIKNELMNSIIEKIDRFNFSQLLLLILFIALVMVLMVICWIPYLHSLNREVWSTKYILTLLPTEEIAKTPIIAAFIKQFVYERKI